MKAKSIQGKSPEEIQVALQQNMADGFKPTLAIVFISVKQDRKAICKLLDEPGLFQGAVYRIPGKELPGSGKTTGRNGKTIIS